MGCIHSRPSKAKPMAYGSQVMTGKYGYLELDPSLAPEKGPGWMQIVILICQVHKAAPYF
eukprot:7387905-Prymnesium_polylepis.2